MGGFLHGSANESWTKSKTWIFEYIVATDLAARGIDIEGVSHVINDAIPQDLSFFVHRVGRTGRNGLPGTAITLYQPSDDSDIGSLKNWASSLSLRSWRLELSKIPMTGTAGLIVKNAKKNLTLRWSAWSRRKRKNQTRLQEKNQMGSWWKRRKAKRAETVRVVGRNVRPNAKLSNSFFQMFRRKHRFSLWTP